MFLISEKIRKDAKEVIKLLSKDTKLCKYAININEKS